MYSTWRNAYISTHTPLARRDQLALDRVGDAFDISTHTPHAGRDVVDPCYHLVNFCISTHTPHAGRDVCLVEIISLFAYFYSHAPCGARLIYSKLILAFVEFLLTRPMRGATPLTSEQIVQKLNFYSHAPCGARRKIQVSSSAA